MVRATIKGRSLDQVQALEDATANYIRHRNQNPVCRQTRKGETDEDGNGAPPAYHPQDDLALLSSMDELGL